MKKSQIIFACALIMALASATLLSAAENEVRKDGKATIKSVHGTVEFSDNGVWKPVKVNMRFGPGTTIRTGGDGVAFISINGSTSAVMLTNATTLQITGMSFTGSAREGDTVTTLNLLSGSVLGNVKKISANSKYEISTPHGVAGIRGTDFQVEAIPQQDGSYLVTFTSVTGTISVSANINGVQVTHTLTTATSWTIGSTPTALTATQIEGFNLEITSLTTLANGTILINGTGPGGNGNGNGNGNGGVNITPPFTSGQPQGEPAS